MQNPDLIAAIPSAINVIKPVPSRGPVANSHGAQ